MNLSEYVTTFTYWILSSLLGLASNSFVIWVALSYRGNTGAVSKASVTFILYLALSDLVYAGSFLGLVLNDLYLLESGAVDRDRVHVNMPMEYHYFSLANRVVGRINIISYTMSIIFIFSITFHRLYVVLRPRHAHTINECGVHGLAVIGIVWNLLITVPVIFTEDRDSSCGNRIAFHIAELCPSDLNTTLPFSDIPGLLNQAGLAFWSIYIVAYLAMILVNAFLLVYAVKYSRAKNHSLRRPLVTVLSVSMVFVCTWTPFIWWLTCMFYLRLRVELGWSVEAGDAGHWLRTLQKLEFVDYFIYSFSMYCNPLIYTLTNKRFRMASRRKLNSLLGIKPSAT